MFDVYAFDLNQKNGKKYVKFLKKMRQKLLNIVIMHGGFVRAFGLMRVPFSLMNIDATS